MKFLDSLQTGLFEPDREVTPGELLFFKFFELFVLVYTLYFSWKWARYTELRNVEVILPLGFANYIDVSLFFDHGITYYLAGILTVLIVCAYLRLGSKWFYLIVFLL